MYLVSRYAGWGRGLWACVDNGTITINDRKKHVHARVSNGLVVEQTTRTKDECTTVRYGQHLNPTTPF